MIEFQVNCDKWVVVFKAVTCSSKFAKISFSTNI